jgi:serine/threonine protein kinase
MITPDATGLAGREERLNEALLVYLDELQAGRQPDREAFLSATSDVELRHDLAEFLDCHEEALRWTGPLRSSAVAGAGKRTPSRVPVSNHRHGVEDPPGDEPGSPAVAIGELGDFRLLRELGRGGMGVVYEAEQISLRRRVALKVLPFAAAVDARRLQRFKTEALAAASLQHERIVPVHAVGCERGVHYYAMPYIEGQSLAGLIAELRHHRAKASADPATTTLSREWSEDRRAYHDRVADLGRQAALALEYAHQAGIVHRDIKPSNLLLDLRGQVWVTDFGLAQVTGDPGLTMTGELLGTLRYASPEQLQVRRGIVDHRSDIYSLGATLYELLTLSPPFEGRDRNELYRQIATDDPRSPRSIDPMIPAELETIVLKALRKEAPDRFATAQELADDLGRFLDRRPILARRPTLAESCRSWGRRHPSVLTAGVVVLTLLTVASLVSTALIRREQGRTWAAQQRAERAYRHERQRADEAEERFRLARRSVDELMRVSEEELVHRAGMEGLRKRLLTSVLAYYQEFIEQRRNDPDAQAELRDTTRRVENILADLAVLRAAGQLYVLAQPSALEDLRLDEVQRKRVTELSARAGKRWWDLFGHPIRLPLAERSRQALELARSNEREIEDILTPAQRSRLGQIALQSEGAAAFREPEVLAALGLTPGQRDRIRAIEEEALFARLRTAGQAANAEPEDPPIEKVNRTDGRILAVLTEEQARRWSGMIGEPLKGTINPFPPMFGRPRDRKGPGR